MIKNGTMVSFEYYKKGIVYGIVVGATSDGLIYRVRAVNEYDWDNLIHDEFFVTAGGIVVIGE